ncbi:MAG: hypothetical protein K9M54_01500 [Kiritimatiellales bacterium]|nr:hypothetical protein [Kiritimatiellales bacterium]
MKPKSAHITFALVSVSFLLLGVYLINLTSEFRTGYVDREKLEARTEKLINSDDIRFIKNNIISLNNLVITSDDYSKSLTDLLTACGVAFLFWGAFQLAIIAILLKSSPNQVEPIVKTPVNEVEEHDTQDHP